eukprot:gene28417-61795_t
MRPKMRQRAGGSVGGAGELASGQAQKPKPGKEVDLRSASLKTREADDDVDVTRGQTADGLD